MNEQQSLISPIIRTSFLLMCICGLIYPAVSTGIAQTLMKEKADGSLIYNNKNEVIGSSLIGQSFEDPRYFHGRVSSIKYDASGSGSNNYAPSNKELLERTKQSTADWKKENPAVEVSDVPIDLLTNSGSGLDPHISKKAAIVQIDRIAEKTGISKERLKELINKNTEGKELGVFGEERVNVLELNMDLHKEL